MGRTGCRVHVIGRRGLPFLGRTPARAPGAFGRGGGPWRSCSSLLTQFVWVLEVDAAPGVPATALRQVLRETGIYEGAWLGGVDTDVTRRAIQTEIPEARGHCHHPHRQRHPRRG